MVYDKDNIWIAHVVIFVNFGKFLKELYIFFTLSENLAPQTYIFPRIYLVIVIKSFVIIKFFEIHFIPIKIYFQTITAIQGSELFGAFFLHFFLNVLSSIMCTE